MVIRGTKVILIFLSILIPLSSFADEEIFKLPIHLKWVNKLKKEKVVTRRPYQFASPVVSEGLVYTGTTSGWFYAFDAKKGKKKWQTKLVGGVYSEPVITTDGIYLANRKGVVYSLDPSNGKLQWQLEVGAEISARPVVTEDTIYVATTIRQIIAMDRFGRGEKWRTIKMGLSPRMTIKGSSSPLLYNGNIYVGYADGTLICYKASDGNIVWVKQLSDRNAPFVDVDSTPVIGNGMIYISSVDGHTYMLDPADGRAVWGIDRGGPNDIFYNGDVIYISGGGVLSAVSSATGNLVWEQNFEEAEISAPVYKDGIIVVASTKDKIYFVDALTGDVKYRRFLGKGSFGKPIMAGDRLYILTNSSRLFALAGS